MRIKKIHSNTLKIYAARAFEKEDCFLTAFLVLTKAQESFRVKKKITDACSGKRQIYEDRKQNVTVSVLIKYKFSALAAVSLCKSHGRIYRNIFKCKYKSNS
jgi:hypothetical protein